MFTTICPGISRTFIVSAMLAFAAAFISPSLWALSSDSDQPMEIEADSAELDDQKRVTIYRGDVVVNQGSLHMTGDVMTVYYDENQELDHAVMEGDLAYYRQMPDDSDVYDEAWARRMEHHGNKGRIILINDAKVVQDGLQFTGKRIDYDTINSRVLAHSTLDKDSAGDTPDTGRQRVRVIISPKKGAGNAPANNTAPTPAD
ncbi:MAG: lipopolysaccharide transport periplasmic protein LptA [Gammaproteobacteria bacterium]